MRNLRLFLIVLFAFLFTSPSFAQVGGSLIYKDVFSGHASLPTAFGSVGFNSAYSSAFNYSDPTSSFGVNAYGHLEANTNTFSATKVLLQPTGKTPPNQRIDVTLGRNFAAQPTYCGPTITVTGASNASPISITCASTANLLTGMTVSISGALGNLAANVSDNAIIVVDATHFTLTGTTGSGTWTSGGQVTNPGVGDFRTIVRYIDSTDYVYVDFGNFTGTAVGSNRANLGVNGQIIDKVVAGVTTAVVTGPSGHLFLLPGHQYQTRLSATNDVGNTTATITFMLWDLTTGTSQYTTSGTLTDTALLAAGQFGVMLGNPPPFDVTEIDTRNAGVTMTASPSTLAPNSTTTVTFTSASDGTSALGPTTWQSVAAPVLSQSVSSGSGVTSISAPTVTSDTSFSCSITTGPNIGQMTFTDATSGLASGTESVYTPTTSGIAYTLTGPTTATQAGSLSALMTVSLPQGFAPPALGSYTITPAMSGPAGTTYKNSDSTSTFTTGQLSITNPTFSFFVKPSNNTTSATTVSRTLTVSSGGSLTDPSGISFNVSPPANGIATCTLTNSGDGTVSVQAPFITGGMIEPVTYSLYRSTSDVGGVIPQAGNGTVVATLSSSTTSGNLTLTDSTPTNGTVYYYRIGDADSGVVGSTQTVGVDTQTVQARPHKTTGVVHWGDSLTAGINGDTVKSDVPTATAMGQTIPASPWTVGGVGTGSEVIAPTGTYLPGLHGDVEAEAEAVTWLTNGAWWVIEGNAGKSGSFISQWVPTDPGGLMLQAMYQFPPQTFPVIEMMIGTNDANASPQVTAAAYYAYAKTICEYAVSSSGGYSAFLWNDPPFYSGVAGASRIADYCNQLKQLVIDEQTLNPGKIFLGDAGSSLQVNTFDYTASQQTLPANFTNWTGGTNPFSVSSAPGRSADGTHWDSTVYGQIGRNWAMGLVNYLNLQPLGISAGAARTHY